MSKKMTNAPVYFVLAQVRFNAVLTLDTYVPAIQDSLRKAGYADFAKMVATEINLNLQGAANQMPAGQIVRNLFMNEDKTAGFILDQTSLTFQTTEYDTFGPFKEAFITGLKIVHTSVGGLNFSERIGVRFLDAVTANADAGEKISDYFAPSLIGLYEKLNKRRLKHIISETWSTLDTTNLMCRAIIQNQTTKGVSFAPDLVPVVLRVAKKFREISGIYGVLDTDAWYENRQKFDLAIIEKLLGDLHGDVRSAFNEMVTQHALRVWE